MKIFTLHSRQQLPVSLDEAWNFFSVPENLDRITPDDLSFEILSGSGERTFAGQLISYRIRPIMNIPMLWVTEITQCVDKQYFIDEQRFGPYRFWHHQHRFTENDQGVLMEDVLHFALPGGWAGELVASGFVRKKVDGIFEHRGKILQDIFPGASPAENKSWAI
jgi:ligand-binding SRPBCC domain-containing protein